MVSAPQKMMVDGFKNDFGQAFLIYPVPLLPTMGVFIGVFRQ
jgi:hypothetical protein